MIGILLTFNWCKVKPSWSIACMGKQQPLFYWSWSSVVINYATPLTPLVHERNSIFKCKQHTSMIPEDQKNITTQWCSTVHSYYQSKLLIDTYQHLNIEIGIICFMFISPFDLKLLMLHYNIGIAFWNVYFT